MRQYLLKYLILVINVLLLCETAIARLSPNAEKKSADYVNPFIGASRRCRTPFDWGKTFRGAATPFGMVQVSLNAITGSTNDVQAWGVSIDDPKTLTKKNKVENAARLLNRFNPPFPNVKLLLDGPADFDYNGINIISAWNKIAAKTVAATAFSSMRKNGKEILHVSNEADIFITIVNGTVMATVADRSKTIKLSQND